MRREHLIWGFVGLVLGAIVFNIATGRRTAPGRAERVEDDPAPLDTARQFGAARPQAASAGGTVGADTGFAFYDDLARARRRQALRAAAGSTYLNEMYAGSDSIVHRWIDRGGRRPIRVALTAPPPPPASPVPGYEPGFLSAVRDAFDRWADVGLPVQLALTEDTLGADVRLTWRERFDTDRTGLTDLRWDRAGAHLGAVITLSTRDSAGLKLTPRQVRIVAMHEIGHLLGLLHSDQPDDLMYPATRAETFSDRDLRTLRVLYSLAPGSFKR